MQKKLLIILTLFILCLGIIYKPVLIKADYGFDSSYDSSGSSSSSSDWSSSSSSSSNESNYNSSSELDLIDILIIILTLIFNILLLIIKNNKKRQLIFLIFIMLVFVIYTICIVIIGYTLLIDSPLEIIITILISIFTLLTIVIIVFRKLKKAIKNTVNKIIKVNNLLKLSDEEIKNKLPDLNIEEFNKIVFNNYKDIQKAWMNFDLDTIKNLVSDEIYNMYSMQLDTLKVKGQKNMMENINFVDNYICDIKIENDTTTISTILSVTCYDYIIDSNNKVIRGNKDKELYYTYRLTFMKNNKTINTCQNCGATIDSKKDTTCPYCSATIVNNNSEWIMTKKEMLKQTTK